MKLLKAAFLLVLTLSASAQNITLLGQWQFLTNNEQLSFVSVENQIAYATTVEKLKIIDVANVKKPTLVGEVKLQSVPFGSIGSLGKPLRVGNHVFVVAESPARLLAVTVANPADPRLVGTLPLPGQIGIGPHEMAYSGGRLHVPLRTGGLAIVGMADPTAMTLLGRATIVEDAYDVEVDNGLAYVAGGANGLQIVEVTDPAAPWIVGTAATGFTTQIELLGTLAYVVSDFNQPVLRVVNVANPVNPAVIYSSAPMSLFRPSLALNASAAYVATESVDGRAFDLSTPTQPSDLGSIYARGNDIALEGSRLYAATAFSGLVIYDVTNKAVPNRQGNFATSQNISEVTVANGYAYIRDAYNGTHIVDVRDPAKPMLLATHASQIGTYNLASVGRTWVSANLAYISTWRGFDIVDVSNPAAPILLGEFRGSVFTTPNVRVSGNFAFTSNGEVVDVSQPANPTIKATLPFPAVAEGIELAGNFLYYVSKWQDTNFFGHSEIGVVDVSNPIAPFKRGTIGNSVGAHRLSLVYPMLFIAGGEVHAVDVSNPDQIRIVYSRPARTADASGANLYSLSYEGTLLLTDISDPWNPFDGPSIPITASDVDAVGAFAYVVSPTPTAPSLAIYQGSVGPAPERPRLQIINQGANLLIRWPKTFEGYQLYSIPGIGQPRQLVTSNPTVDGDYYTFTNTRPVGDALFYVLVKPN
jgi:hypothetical protein